MGKKTTKQIVKKSNALIRCHWSIESIWEPRMVAILASKVNINDEDFHVYEIPVAEIIGSGYGGKNLKDFATAVDRVMGRVITIYDDDGRGWTKYNVFSRCRFIPKKGVVELRFDPDLKPHYLNLKQRFTRYDLTEFMSLPSVYSQRLYEILKSWNDKLEVEIATDELNEMLDTPPSYRQNFLNLRRFVLEPARRDIVEREGSSLWFDWEPIKSGRAGKVIAVHFVFNWAAAKEMKKNQPTDEVFETALLQKESNRCFERIILKDRKKCTPKPKTARCKFCLERGRMAAQKVVEENQGKLPL